MCWRRFRRRKPRVKPRVTALRVTLWVSSLNKVFNLAGTVAVDVAIYVMSAFVACQSYKVARPSHVQAAYVMLSGQLRCVSIIDIDKSLNMSRGKERILNVSRHSRHTLNTHWHNYNTLLLFDVLIDTKTNMADYKLIASENERWQPCKLIPVTSPGNYTTTRVQTSQLFAIYLT